MILILMLLLFFVFINALVILLFTFTDELYEKKEIDENTKINIIDKIIPVLYINKQRKIKEYKSKINKLNKILNYLEKCFDGTYKLYTKSHFFTNDKYQKRLYYYVNLNVKDVYIGLSVKEIPLQFDDAEKETDEDKLETIISYIENNIKNTYVQISVDKTNLYVNCRDKSSIIKVLNTICKLILKKYYSQVREKMLQKELIRIKKEQEILR